MVKLIFGAKGQLEFDTVEQYYEALGSFCNPQAFTITFEPNKSTGSYSDAFRIRRLEAVQKAY